MFPNGHLTCLGMNRILIKLFIILYFLSLPLLKAQIPLYDLSSSFYAKQEVMKKNLIQPFANNVISYVNFGTKPKEDPKKGTYHFFFEYGPVKKTANGSIVKGENSYLAAGMKLHSWYESRPVQLEMDLNYRSITLYDSLNAKSKFGMLELYFGPRLLFSKKAPYYPTFSFLAGAYMPFETAGMGFNILLTAGMYYDFSGHAMTDELVRNGMSFELTYRTATLSFHGMEIPPTFGGRVGFFF